MSRCALGLKMCKLCQVTALANNEAELGVRNGIAKVLYVGFGCAPGGSAVLVLVFQDCTTIRR